MVLGNGYQGTVPVWLPATSLLSSAILLALLLFSRSSRFLTGFGHWLRRVWPPDHETLLPGWLIPFLPLIMIGGAQFYSAALLRTDASQLAWYNDMNKEVVIEGQVVADPEFRDAGTMLVIEAEFLLPGDESKPLPVQGRLLARMVPGGDWRYGDLVRLRGDLQTPFENDEYSYKNYLARQGIHSVVYCSQECADLVSRGAANRIMSVVYALRRRAHATVHRLYPDPEAALLAGILLGIETGIPEGVIDAFRTTGTSHIIAISGFNFAIISGLLIKLFGRLLGRWKSLPAAWIGIGLYAVLAGASAGVVRAAIMGSMSIFAVRIGRRSSGVNTLMFVALLMSLFDPQVLWDVSFQLSFMATLGLILYAEPLSNAFQHLLESWMAPRTARLITLPLSDYLLFTMAAQLTTLPLILNIFKKASFVSLLANPLILPAQPPLMVMGGLSVLGGMITEPLGRFIAFFNWPLIAYSIRIVETLANSWMSSWKIGAIGLYQLAGYYSLLFVLTAFGAKWLAIVREKLDLSGGRLIWLSNLGLLLATITVWQQVLAIPDGKMHLTVLDVGGGDGLFIQTPTGRRLLINGGSSPNALADALGRRLPFLQREIDFVVVAGSEDQQIGALAGGFDRFSATNVLWAGPKGGSYSARELEKQLSDSQTSFFEAEKGQRLDLGDGAWIEIASVTPRGAVLMLNWGNFSALLPIGLDFDSKDALMDEHRYPEVSVLLLADSGFAPLNPPEWIERWQPQVILLSAAAGAEDARMDSTVLQALKGRTLLRTDLHGWIKLSTDGKSMWVEVEKSPQDE